jgi:predicted small lipoprotein YifL
MGELLRGGAVTRRLPWPAALVTLAVLAACEHAQPFGAPPAEPNVPYDTAFPRQLTFSPGLNLSPAWLPNDSGIIYSFSLLRPDNDRCLGILPAEGGHQSRTACHTPIALDADSTNALFEPAAGPGGVLAYIREGSLLGAVAPSRRDLVVASLAAPDPGRVVISFPYTAPDGVLHSGASHIHWVGATALVYLAEQINYITNGTFADTVVVPLAIVRADLSGASPALTVVPGTTGATSLVVDSTGAIIYTLPGDSHVYRRDAAGGAPAALYDFGSAGIPSDVQASGNVLVALIGGKLVRAKLGDTVVVPIPSDTTQVLRRPALAPSGTRVVVQLSGRAPSNLWLLQVP